MGNFKRQTMGNTTQRQIKRRTTRSIMNAQASAINQSNNKHSFELQPFDVLCGRNKTSYNNIGNRRFRILINLNLPHYLECQSRNERSGMILSLTRDLCCCSDESQNYDKLPSPNSCVRFFKSQKGVNELIELDFKGCREKIGHALRDAATQHNNSSNSSKSKEVIYETTRKQQQQQKEEEAIVKISFPILIIITETMILRITMELTMILLQVLVLLEIRVDTVWRYYIVCGKKQCQIYHLSFSIMQLITIITKMIVVTISKNPIALLVMGSIQ